MTYDIMFLRISESEIPLSRHVCFMTIKVTVMTTG